MMPRAPFAPLVSGGESLRARPAPPRALERRMGALYGVPEECVLAVRDSAHGLELALRAAIANGATSFAAAPGAETERLAKIFRLSVLAPDAGSAGVVALASPDGERTLGPEQARARAAAAAPGLLVIDEALIEFTEAPSLAALAAGGGGIIVLRSLSFAHGLAGAPCGAAIAAPALIERLRAMIEPFALAAPVVQLALDALDPSRIALTEQRIAGVKRERARIGAALGADAREGAGPFVDFTPPDRAAALRALDKYAVSAEALADGRVRLPIGAPEENDRLLAALGAPSASPPVRRAEIVRDTKETRIAVAVTLDGGGKADIQTGLGFYDHMLSQVALHGGFSLSLACAGDLEVDAHHTIEDCALALGQALKQALGERRGIARFGFLLPMDETEARVSIDLGGRPYAVFEGAFEAPLIGAYPTQMTEHVFRSLAQSLGAAINVSVSGQNDHHKTEACYKAFGRALRQAIRMEDDLMPSTKGVI